MNYAKQLTEKLRQKGITKKSLAETMEITESGLHYKFAKNGFTPAEKYFIDSIVEADNLLELLKSVEFQKAIFIAKGINDAEIMQILDKQIEVIKRMIKF